MTKRSYKLSTPMPRTDLIAAFRAANEPPYWMLEMTQDERDKAASSGAAMPDGSYPVTTCDGENSVSTAVHAVGRAGADHDAVRKHIMKRAESLGCKSLIPDNWNADGSLKASKLATPPAKPAAPAPAAPPAKDTPVADSKPYEPEPYKADPDELVTCPECKKGNDNDAHFCDQCGFDLTSTGFEPAPYKEDPDETVVCPQCSKHDDTDASYCDQCGFKLAGASGVTTEASTEPAPDKPDAEGGPSPVNHDPSAAPVVKAAKLAVSNTTPVTNPVDEDGNVDPNTVCTTDGCGHLASAHQDLPEGDNSGPCQMQNCDCQEMDFDSGVGTPSDPEGDDSDGSGDVDPPVPVNDTAKTSGSVAAFAPTDVTPGQSDGPVMAPADSNPPPEVQGGANMGPAFTIPVMVIEGQSTGDGRAIALDALTWGVMPMPLMGMATATHDPNGFDMNDPSVICGRIDGIERAPGENGTQIISATGYFLANDDGQYFADLVEQMGRVGISADIAVDEAQETISGMDEFGWPTFESTLTAGTIQGCTIVPFPAFEGAYIVLGDGSVTPEIPQQVADAMPVPAVVAAGGQLVHLMARGQCVPCDSGIDVMVASGGPLRPPSAWFSNPNFTEGDGRLREIFTGRGERRFGGAYAVPFTITDEGEVYGHIAPWGVCHTGNAGSCLTAPHSKANYAHFMRGNQRVVTAEGDEVAVGVLTSMAGHASTGPRVTASQAMAHYDNIATAFADVVVGEDEYGIWVHGALRPDVDEARLRAIRASSMSGDWREINGNLELVAVLAVNQPGFPTAVVADGRPTTLVAAGAYQMAELIDEPVEQPVETFTDHALRTAMAPFLESERARLRQLKLEAQKADARRRYRRR